MNNPVIANRYRKQCDNSGMKANATLVVELEVEINGRKMDLLAIAPVPDEQVRDQDTIFVELNAHFGVEIISDES